MSFNIYLFLSTYIIKSHWMPLPPLDTYLLQTPEYGTHPGKEKVFDDESQHCRLEIMW